MKLEWTKAGTGWKTKDERFFVKHTGTAGRSTRVFTAYNRVGQEMMIGGLKECKEACETIARHMDELASALKV